MLNSIDAFKTGLFPISMNINVWVRYDHSASGPQNGREHPRTQHLVRIKYLKFSVGQPSCPNYVDSFTHNSHHISELDRLCKEGLLVDDTVEFKSFTSTFTNFVAKHGGHSFALTCHYWSPICCNSTQLISTKSHRVNRIWRSFKNIVTLCCACKTLQIKQLLCDAEIVINTSKKIRSCVVPEPSVLSSHAIAYCKRNSRQVV